MAGTRSSARLAGSGSSPDKSDSGNKRKAEDSSPQTNKAKRGKKAGAQKTLEETGIDTNQDEPQPEQKQEQEQKPEQSESKDVEMKDDNEECESAQTCTRSKWQAIRFDIRLIQNSESQR